MAKRTTQKTAKAKVRAPAKRKVAGSTKAPKFGTPEFRAMYGRKPAGAGSGKAKR